MNDIEFLYGELINFECIEREAYEDAYNVLCTLDYAITETKDEKENEMSWSKERLEKVMKDRKIEREKMREECIIGVVESDENE